ncbi:MAG: hypothetical protein R2860_00200 [Desulfobacterales bacterium]
MKGKHGGLFNRHSKGPSVSATVSVAASGAKTGGGRIPGNFAAMSGSWESWIACRDWVSKSPMCRGSASNSKHKNQAGRRKETYLRKRPPFLHQTLRSFS